ncbi:MAG: hypothetical protein ABSF83_05020 [Nitrososphaerales archaeon]
MERASLLGRLDLAVRSMGGSLLANEGGASAKREALGGVFWIDDEIGRAARGCPPLEPALRAMQLEVNSMTIAIKRDRLDAAREAFGRVESCLERVREEERRLRPSSPALGR